MNYNTIRKKTKEIKIGGITVGGDNPVAVQSMLNTKGSDKPACIAQCKALEEAGCEIIRMSVPDTECVPTFYAIKSAGIKVPLVADIHFDYRLAIESAAAGADKIRINPGNIGGEENVKKLVAACKKYSTPIRIGVNGGSLKKEILAKYGSPTPEALYESAMEHVRLLEKYDFDDIVISVKSSSAADMISACRLLSGACDYPLHIGVTEAGFGNDALIKASAGLGTLLMLGIGDTVRVSLTDDPVKEVVAAKKILGTLGVREFGGIEIVSCPTCGRTRIDIINISRALSERFSATETRGKKIKVAVMGCVVNGPGEAREADIGIAGGDGCAVLISRGQTIRRITEDEIIPVLESEVQKLISEK